MTVGGFIFSIEGYYGEYQNDLVKKAVDKYLRSYPEKNLDKLLNLVMRNHFTRLGTPCMASIDKIHTFYHLGDYMRRIEGHKSLKIEDKVISATRNIIEDIDPDDMPSEEEVVNIFAKIGELITN